MTAVTKRATRALRYAVREERLSRQAYDRLNLATAHPAQIRVARRNRDRARRDLAFAADEWERAVAFDERYGREPAI